jgi:hypothetical protein
MVHHTQINKCNIAHKWNKGQKYMFISIDAEKVFDKIHHPIMIKALKKLGIEGRYLNIIKAIHAKPTDNMVLSGEKLKSFPLKS